MATRMCISLLKRFSTRSDDESGLVAENIDGGMAGSGGTQFDQDQVGEEDEDMDFTDVRFEDAGEYPLL